MSAPTTDRSALTPVFWVFWTGTLINRAATFAGTFLVLYLTTDRGMSATAAGAVLALQGAGMAFSNLLGGWLADRWGRRSTMLVGLSLTAVMVLALAEVRSPVLIAPLVALMGLAADLHRPALSAFIADAVPEGDRARAYSLLHWATNLGISIAMVAGGLLAEVGYAWLFRLDALATVIFVALIWRLVPADAAQPAPVAAEHEPPPGTPWWRDRSMVVFAAVTTLIFVIYFQAYATLPLAVTDAGHSPADYGLVLAVNGGTVAVLQPLLVRYLGRLPQRPGLAGGYLLIGIGYGLVAFTDNLATLAGTVLLWSLGEIVVIAIGSAFVAGLAPADARGRYMGAYGMSIAAAGAVAPLLGTAVYAWNQNLLWLGSFLASVLAAGLQLTVRPRPAAVVPVAIREEGEKGRG
ncbi:MFS transporter [Actinoplanes sp. L3-i22]|uniref:MDR family MFS transporter n=1 Tax=Actinoplanes sp. L3-i22 TaxID=2836373 RepID=UPI001C778F64|nr:MFS transporter [Actinoplanes sp. L3-i22]BCY09078.1 multidrug resistance protein [Actinoplanes sp. L3-i22]